MIVTVKDRKTNLVVFSVDVNAEGNVHDVLVQQNGASYKLTGESYGQGLNLESDGALVVQCGTSERVVLVRPA